MTTRAQPQHCRTAPGSIAAPRRCRNDTGSASTELVIVMPLLLLLVLASVHVGLWFHARHLVNAAAQEGARAARATGANDDDGYQRADQMLHDLGSGSVTVPVVTVTRNAHTVTVTVSGQSPAVIPGLTVPVSATSTSPIEEFKK
jgi:Flp pilus assembly protein TadG